MKKNSGFTLIELLIVIGIIAILAAVVIVALNPARQFSQARNTQRSSNVNTILNAVGQYISDNNGSLPASVTALTVDTPTQICATGAADCTGLVNLSVLTNSEIYLLSIPVDPAASTTGGVGYAVWRTSNNRVGVTALGAELDQKITVRR